ncbi:hydroxysqualene dehydroxylase HpnE [Solimicrobium silvestre]|uniref:HpnE: squalene-associated FAD-dependent desaturase n=1 Tax=Solimicrobium silvestre TaxID=2099400 RepID=A0A2S9GVI8_9BURK|nr:hydroxysqualene dehydroxylase HpnE [Solimicrobium silvestre]PRC91721.1 HpnE: squalene-associated FAD-dependent desaturase [Solimicrobium silvestre]
MKYAVIGAGWAGCSAAVELAKRGHQVHLFEAARTLGGRARQVSSHDLMLDNGQHILLGAYKATLALLSTLGINQKTTLLRLPLQMCYPPDSGGMEFIAPKLPAPWHVAVALLKASGLTRADKMALMRFSSTARWMGWQLNNDCSVAELLHRYDQTDNLTRLMWQPLCIAALNTPIHRASAQVFLNVLKDSLGAKRAASDMLIARTDLTSLLPQPAAQFIEAQGGQVHLGCAVHSIEKNTEWQLNFQQTQANFDGVVIATSAEVASNLLAPLNMAEHIPTFEYEPITTCYLKYATDIKLARPFLALVERPEHSAWGQFVFDRGQIEGEKAGGIAAQAGLFAVVVSTSQQAIEHGHAELAFNCAKQLAVDLMRPELAVPEWSQVITEKRATFACTPGLVRPANQLPVSGLVLAGDYTESSYPATLESAVQSGVLAANLLM